MAGSSRATLIGGSASAIRRLTDRAGNCRFLLASLVALLIAFPFLEDVARPMILVMPLAGVFVAGVVVVESGAASIRRALAIAAVQLASTASSFFLKDTEVPYLVAVSMALGATVLLIVYSTYCVLGYVLRARTISRDQIYAGVSMYLMFGFAFGAVFYLISILDPNSFSVNTGSHAPGDSPDLLYFSFVTLATLGYGDITPRTNIARSLAVVEALVGMLYIAIFMARLVSLHTGNEDLE